MKMCSEEDKSEANELPPATIEQIRRVNVMLELAAKCESPDAKFIQWVCALHLARAIPEYYYTLADSIAIELEKAGAARTALKDRLRKEFEAEFQSARRYKLVSELRHWDFHWEPIINAQTVAPGMTYGRGAPLKLSVGPGAGSATYSGSNTLITTGSGKRVGRANYYQIKQSRYVDSEAGEALPLGMAIQQFLEELPNCIAAILAKPEVVAYLKRRE
jgi:hypothetical protein